MRSPNSLVCEWFEQVWNARDAGAVRRLSAPGLQAHGGDGTTRGQAEMQAFQKLFLDAIPDLHLRVTHCVETHGMAAAHWVATGTHGGATVELGPPTGRPIELQGLSLVRIEDGLIVEGWDDYDHIGLMRQLGAAV